MKKYIEVFIENKILDLPSEGINLTLDFKVQDLDGGTTSSNSRRSISFPATKQNSEVFDYWYDVSRDNEQGAYLKASSINIDGLQLFTGQAQLNEVKGRANTYGIVGREYKVAFYSGNGDWIQQLKGVKLRDLDYTSDAHDFTEANIIAGLSGTPTNYAYGVVKLKNWGYTDSIGDAVVITECTPLIYVKALFDKIFRQLLGYTIVSDFYATNLFGGLNIPLPLPEKYPQEYSEDYLNVAAIRTGTRAYSLSGIAIDGIDFTTQTKAPLVGADPFQESTVGFFSGTTSSDYTAPDTGFYKVRLSVTLDNIVGTNTILLATVPTAATSPVGTVYTIDAANNGDTFTHELVYQMNQGEQLEPLFSISSGSIAFDLIGASIEIIGEASIQEGTLIDFKYLMRNWTVTDFLKGVIECFNLQFETNTAERKIYFEPKDTYKYTERYPTIIEEFRDGFLRSTNTDSTFKLDLSKDFKINPNNDTEQKQKFLFTDGNDDTYDSLSSGEDLGVYQCEFNLPIERYKEGTRERENSFFAPCLHLLDDSIKGTSSVNTLVPQVPLIWNGDYRENPSSSDMIAYEDYVPRLLWFGGNRFGLDGIFRLRRSGVTTQPFLPALFAINFNDTTGLDPVLSYANVSINQSVVEGLTQRYYLREMARLRVNKTVECYLFLSLRDVLNLSFRDLIYINQDEYILMSVEGYDPQRSNSTKCVLMYNNIESTTEADNLDSALVEGVLSDVYDS